jgi:hypothetical protein
MYFPVLVSLFAATIALAEEWPIPIPVSLLTPHRDQIALSLKMSRPDNVRLIQTVEGRYQWTDDIEKLLREGVKLMDVTPSQQD